MPDIIHRIGTTAPATAVYDAVATPSGIAGWWSHATSGESRVGGVITSKFHNPDGVEIGAFEYELLTLRPDEEVRWRITAGPDEWVGTDIHFRISRDGDHTIVLFAHRGWREEVEFMAHCSMKWGVFLLSLRDFVETGAGQPSPEDRKIDNWN